MFHLRHTRQGEHALLQLKSTDGRTGLTAVPARGGCLTSLRLAGVELLDGYRTEEELNHLSWAKSGLLFPFPNRLQDGSYTWNGHTYQFQQNEAKHGNALHGFGLDAPFQTTAVYLAADWAAVEFTYFHSGRTAYPFSFKLGVRYTLHVSNQFTFSWNVENRGTETMPFAWGWHPYFTLGGPPEDYKLQLPPCKHVLVDDRMLPAGNEVPFSAFNSPSVLGERSLDHCLRLLPGAESVRLFGTAGELQMRLSPTQTFLQIFTPPHRKSLAIEPMWGNINAFQNGDGLLHIPPAASWHDRVQLNFRAK